MCSNAQQCSGWGCHEHLLLSHRQHKANAAQQHTAMVNFVVQLESNSQAITMAGEAMNKGRLPQHGSEKRLIPEND